MAVKIFHYTKSAPDIRKTIGHYKRVIRAKLYPFKKNEFLRALRGDAVKILQWKTIVNYQT